MFLSPGSRSDRSRHGQVTTRRSGLSLGPYHLANAGILQAATIQCSFSEAVAFQLSPGYITNHPVTSAYVIAMAPAIAAQSSGAITSFYGFRSEPLFNSGSGIITNCYGIYADAQTAGSVTNRSIFVSGGVSEFNGQLIAQGTQTNDNAAAGDIGEIISSTVLAGASVPLTSSVAADITSIALTGGDWDVWGNIVTNPNAATTSTFTSGWISATSATFPTAPNSGAYAAFSLSTGAGAALGIPVGTTRISLAGATTIFLSCFVTFSVSTMGGYGYIGARRVR